MNKIISIPLFIALFLGNSVYSQPQFIKKYHPCPSQVAVTLLKSPTQGYYLVSNVTEAGGERSILLTGFDNNLNVIWSRLIGETGFYEWAFQADIDQNENIYVCGVIYDSACATTGFILKTDSNGNIIWEYKYSNSNINNFSSLACIGNKIYVTGSVGYGDCSSITVAAFTSKFDSNGNLIWANKQAFSSHNTSGMKLIESGDNNLISIFGGGILSLIYSGLIRIDTLGSFSWMNIWNVTESYPNAYGSIADLILTNSNGFTAVGNKGTLNGGDESDVLIRIDSQGVLQDYIHFDFPLSDQKIVQTADFGYAISGILYGKFIILKVDSNLNPIWGRKYNITIAQSIASILETSDNGILLCGTLGNKVYLFKTDSLGFTSCIDSSFMNPVISDTLISVNITVPISQNINATLASPILSSISSLSIDTVCFVLSSNLLSENFGYTLYPNPASNQFTVDSKQETMKEIEIFNLMGKKVYTAAFSSEQVTVIPITIGIEHFPQGVYFVTVTNERGMKSTSKVIVMK